MLYVDLFESQVIARFAYDSGESRLLIQFKTGGLYLYEAVPRAVFDGFREAPSKGQFFQATIRDRFAARRLSASEWAAVESRRGPGAAPTHDRGRVDLAALERTWKATIFF
jgi:lysyl-tRNA synthetase class 2